MAGSLTPEIIVLIAGAFFTLGYLIIHQALLRVMLLIGTGFYLWYYATVEEQPLWEAIYVSSIMGFANLVGLISLFVRKSRLTIPRQHRDIYARFPDLPPGDFRDLMRFATRRVTTETEQITEEGRPVDTLTFVVSGHLHLEKKGQQFEMPEGFFVGEIAYLTGQTASASTWVEPGSEILQWKSASLAQKCTRNDRFRLALEALISKDLATKVAGSIAQRNFDWRKGGQARTVTG